MLLRAKTSCSSSNSNTSTTSSKRFDKRFLYSNAESRRRLTLVVFHGINIDKEELVLDGSEAPVRTEAETLLASEKLALAATLRKITIPYQPVAAELCSLPTDRDKLPSDKCILTLKLT